MISGEGSMSDREEKIKLGSDTAKGGFNNEKDVVEMFNSWKKNAFAQQWLNKLGYNLKEIEEVKARTLSGYKTDVQVVIITKSGLEKVENFQVKLVSNERGYNQIDKRWVKRYKELWGFNPKVEELLKKFTGEMKPSGVTKDERRTKMNEFSDSERSIIINWFKDNRSLVVSDLLKGSGEFQAEWMLVIQNVEGNYTWILNPMDEVLQKMGLDGDVKISPRGSLRIGKITMQRKGGDGGRPTANQLQFKINPIDLLD
jgi:hypothetical protein